MELPFLNQSNCVKMASQAFTNSGMALLGLRALEAN